MYLTIICVMALLVNGVVQIDQEETKTKDYSAANARYEELVEQLKADVSSVDFDVLRRIYVKTEYYAPYSSSETKDTANMNEGINEEDWGKCLESATRILSYSYISLDAHYGAMICSRNSNDTQSGDFHESVLDGLLESIWVSGDGRSPETAFFCTSLQERWAFLGMHGLVYNVKELEVHDGLYFDVVHVTNLADSSQFKLYFDVTTPLRRGRR